MKNILISGIEIYQSEFELLDSNMYVIVKNNKVLVIDPHYSRDFEHFLKKRTFDDVTIFLTHEHPDHTSGIPWLVENFTTKLICSKICSSVIKKEKNNRPTLINFILAKKDKEERTNKRNLVHDFFKPYSCTANVEYDDQFTFDWEGICIYSKNTPGHSIGSVSIILDNRFIFTGDSLLKEISVITRFQGGNLEDYNNITLPFYRNLSGEFIVFPGHGDMFRLKEKNLEEI